MPLLPSSRENICKLIADAFNIDDLKALTRFRLGFRLETHVMIKALNETVFALLDYIERCGSIRTLLGACILLRPARADMVQEFNRILVEEIGGPLKDTDLMIGQIVQGIEEVRVLRTVNPEVLEAVERVKDRLDELKRGIDLLRAYKSLHDGLHQLQMGLRRFANAARNFSKNPILLIDLQESIGEMQSLRIRAASDIAALPARLRGTENGWLDRLEEAIGLANDEITQRDSMNGRSSVMCVQGILRHHAPRINAEIVQACEALDIEGLRQLFLNTAAREGVPVEKKDALLAARDAAASIVVEVAALVGQHDAWQWIDDYLWQMADSLPQDSGKDPADFDAGYIRVQKYLKELISAEAPAVTGTATPGGITPWMVKLPAVQSTVEASRKTGDWPMLFVNFTSFRLEAMFCFVAVDSRLKILATQVADIGGSLEQLID